MFEQPKIVTQDLATYSWFGFEDKGFYPINTCYIWPTADLYILGWLCSPTAWWICHRMLQHAINDTLRMFGEQVKTLPIALPTEAIRAEVEPLVARLIQIAQSNYETRQITLDWLRARFGLDSPGAALEDLAGLDLQAFISEVGKRLPKNALTPGAVKDLSKGYRRAITIKPRPCVSGWAKQQDWSAGWPIWSTLPMG